TVGAPVIEGHARNSLGATLGMLGRDIEGLDQLHRARELALETSSWNDLARAAANEGAALQTLARHHEALALSLDGAEHARAHGLERSCGVFLRLNASETLWRLGRWDEFEEQLREIEHSEPVGHDGGRLLELRAMFAIARGRFDDARADILRLPETASDDL